MALAHDVTASLLISLALVVVPLQVILIRPLRKEVTFVVPSTFTQPGLKNAAAVRTMPMTRTMLKTTCSREEHMTTKSEKMGQTG